jgi:hypothetical protein
MLAPSEFIIVWRLERPQWYTDQRRYSGPLQEIKKERRTDSVAFRPIWEYKTSVLTARRGRV